MLLQGNALGGEGLTNLCPGLAACITMSEVNLRAVGVTDQHQQAVRLFADVASCHPMLQIINLDGNLIGTELGLDWTKWLQGGQACWKRFYDGCKIESFSIASRTCSLCCAKAVILQSGQSM